MKLLRFIMHIFYRYYSKGGTFRIPYFSALCAVVFLLYMHIFQVLIIFDGVDLLPMNENSSKINRYWQLALFLLPIFLVVAALVKEKDLKNAVYEEDKIKRGGIYLVFYIIASFVLLITLMFVFAKK